MVLITTILAITIKEYYGVHGDLASNEWDQVNCLLLNAKYYGAT